MAYMGQDNLKTNLSNAQRVYNWEIIIANPVGEGNTEELLIRARSTSIPGRLLGMININYKQNAPIKIAGKPSYSGPLPIVFNEGEDGKIYNALHSWQQLIVNADTGTGVPDSEYKRDVVLNLLSTDGSITRSIKLIGSWPQNIPDTPISYDNEDVVQYTGEFAFDRVGS